MKESYLIRIRGIVQGVGFRPFVYRLARQYGITGSVCNDGQGVLVRAEGNRSDLDRFIRDISGNPPPLARIEEVETSPAGYRGYSSFSVTGSKTGKEKNTFIPPDTRVCDQCLTEYQNTRDRRYRYPFITCTHCGPRFSIIRDIPYDRKNTTMAPFPLCNECHREYRDPLDRRFHTQPTACPRCGPRLSLADPQGHCLIRGDVPEIVSRVISDLDQGKIVALKGVGGYHLACDATNSRAVRRLRSRKKRPFKPFALMTGNLDSAARVVELGKRERELLESAQRPIVLLREKPNRILSPQVAPHLSHQGIMLPYSPFQFSLFEDNPLRFLVMTSANISDEPIIYSDREIFGKMGRVADLFVTYNRDIHTPSDDSVLFVVDEQSHFIRRSKGYVPVPFFSSPAPVDILATGADLKNTFGLAKDKFLIISQPTGDLQSPATQEEMLRSLDNFTTLFDLDPRVVVSDRHPGYFSTSIGRRLTRKGASWTRVYHHHAHIASVLEEHRSAGPVIGLAFDGTGYGADGHLWGGEFLVADTTGFQRAAHFSYFPLPGGEKAILEVYRIGLALLYQAYGENIPLPLSPRDRQIITLIRKDIHCPRCCSLGRIFDGISSLLGISRVITTEAEAAIRLEETAFKSSDQNRFFPIRYRPHPLPDADFLIETESLVQAIVGLIHDRVPLPVISYAFHQSLARLTGEICAELRKIHQINRVALSGGVFQNRLLLKQIIDQLQKKQFQVLTHRELPPNDGCIAHGQLAVAKAWWKKGILQP